MIATMLSLLFAVEKSFWMPRGASTVAANIDLVFYIILGVSVFFFVGIVGAMALFAVQYRQKDPSQKTHPISGNNKLEFHWTFWPTLGLMALFAYGFVYWIDLAVPPGDSMEIRVQAKRWVWNFDYPRHKLSGTSELIVPQDRNIKLVMISADVLHSFYVPEFRVKRDVLPNRYTVLWFNVPKKSLTRLKTVKKSALEIQNVLLSMGFAKDKAAAMKLVTDGHVRINDKKVTLVNQGLKLNDRIHIHVDKKVKEKLFNIRREYDKKIKAALGKKDEAGAEALRKEKSKAFNTAAPQHVVDVLAAMRAFKAKKDQKTPEWLFADRDGLDGMWGFVSDTFNIFCTEYCGKEHSKMITRVRVVGPKLFNFWLQRSLSKSPTGKQLMERYGCTSCHSMDGSANTGPTFKGLYGRKETVLDKKDGKIRTLHLIDKGKDRLFSDYIRESILMPQSKIVKGYETQIMPTFRGQISNQHINILIDYIRYYKPKGSK